MRRKYTKDVKGADAVVWGIPFDAAVTNRPGARFGPQAIRRASAILDNDPQYPFSRDLFEHLAVVDYGDCLLDSGNHQKTPGTIEREAAKILKSGAFLLTLGGDHFVTWPLLKAHVVTIGIVCGDGGEPAALAACLDALHGLVHRDENIAVRLHGLEVAGKLRAVTGSSRSGKRLICEFGAIAEDDLASSSPGDFLFFDNIQEACETGFAVYDFSVGDEPYKRQWCDIETRHFEVLVPLTLKGRALAQTLRQGARLKAFVKNSPTIWKLTKMLRRKAAGQAAAATDEN